MARTIFGSAMAIGMLCMACSAPKPAVIKKDPGLYIQPHAVAVTVKDGWFTAKTLTLGEYATSSRTNGVAANTPPKQWRSVSDAFYFSVKTAEEQFPVQVLSAPRITFSNRPLPASLSTLPGDALLWYVTLGAVSSAPLKNWEFILKRNISFVELNENKQVGILRSATDELKVTAHNRYGTRNSYEKTCYEFQLRGMPVAAVIPGETPQAWMHEKADAALRQTLAGAMLALVFNEKLGAR
ncbi:hypothetical protein [Chitinophaga sp.]|uniref:hypothetical protein n=1 Tax=Chitinophaga sp. TaxID=1869181 RepID=UPI0031E2F833